MPDLVISPELARVLPALADEELAQLEANLVEDGRVIDPILFFPLDGKSIILDGMNRYPIATKHGLPFTSELHPGVTTMDAAELWVLNHQLGRRNLLKPASLRKVRGELYNRMKGQHGGDRKSTPDGSKVQNEPLISGDDDNTAQVVAERAGVSESTVKRDGKYAAALGKLPDVLAKAIETGTIKATEAAVIKLASCDRSVQNDVGRDVRVGKEPSIQASLQARGLLKKPEPKADKPDAKPQKQKPGTKGIQALTGEEAEAFDARQQVKVWSETIGRWLQQLPSIDGYRKKYPGKEGDRVVKAATELYEALKLWGKAIK